MTIIFNKQFFRVEGRSRDNSEFATATEIVRNTRCEYNDYIIVLMNSHDRYHLITFHPQIHNCCSGQPSTSVRQSLHIKTPTYHLPSRNINQPLTTGHHCQPLTILNRPGGEASPCQPQCNHTTSFNRHSNLFDCVTTMQPLPPYWTTPVSRTCRWPGPRICGAPRLPVTQRKRWCGLTSMEVIAVDGGDCFAIMRSQSIIAHDAQWSMVLLLVTGNC